MYASFLYGNHMVHGHGSDCSESNLICCHYTSIVEHVTVHFTPWHVLEEELCLHVREEEVCLQNATWSPASRIGRGTINVCCSTSHVVAHAVMLDRWACYQVKVSRSA